MKHDEPERVSYLILQNFWVLIENGELKGHERPRISRFTKNHQKITKSPGVPPSGRLRWCMANDFSPRIGQAERLQSDPSTARPSNCLSRTPAADDHLGPSRGRFAAGRCQWQIRPILLHAAGGKAVLQAFC